MYQNLNVSILGLVVAKFQNVQFCRHTMAVSDDDWGDLDSNVEDDDYDQVIDNHTEQIIKYQFTNNSSKYKIHTQNEVRIQIETTVQKVANYLDLSEDHWAVNLLLRHFKWNEEQLLQEYFEYDAYELLAKCGVLSKKQRQQPKYKKGVFECPMCLDAVKVSNSFSMDGHQICNDCFQHYIISNITKSMDCINMTFPFYKCNVIIPPQYILKFIPFNMKDLLYRYQRFTLENYIEVRK